MRILLDTHAFLSNDLEPHRMSPTILTVLASPDATVFLSVVSVWEILIKQGAGKLTLNDPLRETLADYRERNRLQVLPVLLDHVMAIENLPLHHKDPFDRLLIAQAIAEDLTVATADPLFADYPVSTLW